MFDPRARATLLGIAPGQRAVVIDGALSEPRRWVELAARHRAHFAAAEGNAFPGPELRLPDAVTARFATFFAQHARAALGARRVERCHGRFSLATRQPHELEPRQWIAHRDRLEPGALTAAGVLYLFDDARLGGTAFFTPRRDVRRLVHDSGHLAPAAFASTYGLDATYMTADNAWFERTGTVPARFNRLVFYDGGAVFHTSDIAEPALLTDDPRTGRLTVNVFFVCRAAAGSGGAQ